MVIPTIQYLAAAVAAPFRAALRTTRIPVTYLTAPPVGTPMLVRNRNVRAEE